MANKFYIKERQNPQLGTYYVAKGQMTKKAAKLIEDATKYGENFMQEYHTEEAYNQALKDLKERGERIL